MSLESPTKSYLLHDRVIRNIRTFVLHAKPDGMEQAEQFVLAGREILEALPEPKAEPEASIKPDAQDSASTSGNAEKQ